MKTSTDISTLERNLCAVYARATAADKRDGSLWYPKAQDIMRSWSEAYGVTRETAACVTAAISPQCDWERNLIIADDILAGRLPSVGGALPANVRKAQLILNRRVPTGFDSVFGMMREVFPGGPKVTHFALNLCGHMDAITIDTHCIQAAWNSPEITITLPWQRYMKVAIAYEHAAQRFGMRSATFQSVIWHAWKSLYPWNTKKRVRRQYV